MKEVDPRYIDAVMNIFNAIPIYNSKPEENQGMMKASELLEQRVPFWTGLEDPRNAEAEEDIIDYFKARPNTLSVRDVRASQIAWSIEVVGKKNANVQHIRILCDVEADYDVLNLPFEVERVGNGGNYEQIGWGEHFDVDFLVFYSFKAKLFRLLNRDKLAKYLQDGHTSGIQYQSIERRIPRDPLSRHAHGFLIPIQELEDNNIILETSFITAQE